MKKILLLIVVSAIFYACNSNDDDDGLFQVKEQAKADSLDKIAPLVLITDEDGHVVDVKQ